LKKPCVKGRAAYRNIREWSYNEVFDAINHVREPIVDLSGEVSMSQSGAKRIQHYMFAHRVIPQLFYGDPAKFFDIFSRDADRFVSFYWDKLGEQITQPEGRVDGAGLRGEVRTLAGDIQLALITMPAPAAVAEAYFTAAAYRPQAEGASLARYFTLEYGINIPDGNPRTVFCGWTAEGAHFNMGDGPAADPELFIDVVQARLDTMIGPDVPSAPSVPSVPS
jgi:hypothetical protein